MTKYFISGLFIFLTASLCAQNSISGGNLAAGSGSESQLTEASRMTDTNLFRTQLALSSADYQVTAGDLYSLNYMAGTVRVDYPIPVDSTYRIRVSNLGVINAAGRTFNQLKSQVETIVSNNYPMSGVQFVLIRPATFKVLLTGEVRDSVEVTAWALSRLSELIAGHVTPYGSLRDISIKSADGQVKAYDIFAAKRDGELSQDPYLRPGDVITINRLERAVTITGAVERPGTYQLKENENLRELVEKYGNGFSPIADGTRIELVRRVNSSEVSGNKVFLHERDFLDNYTLENFDEVTIPQIIQLQPVMFVEGAINESGETEDTVISSPTASTRLVVQFTRGESYASLVRRNSRWFSAVSDTLNAYIIRDNEHIPLNLNPMLYDAGYRGEAVVRENDTLIIPFRQYFVTVAGAVLVPGRYPYIPDREWDYYIALAGGFVPGRNTLNSVKIVDISGRKLNKSDTITPETVITAQTNDFLYYFNQYAPVITTVLTVITTFFSLQAYMAVR
ncbi:MAG: SLBB domain-containing protein [Treponema sp.]|jgi:protein involved in polysaccharide export with SLBB domain|nr:SLBB domain-containing protein [Treponema sp.]